MESKTSADMEDTESDYIHIHYRKTNKQRVVNDISL